MPMMKMTDEIAALLKKEIVLEWRQRFAINGILLYLGSTVFVCYLSFGVKGNKLSPYVWNALFWVILLFTSVNAIAKSFIQERQGRLIYYYSLVSPQGIIISKILYNSLLMMLLSSIGFLFYSLVLGNPVQDKLLFFLNIILGSLGFSSTLTMVSGIASKANNSATLMAILSFPIIIPLLLILIKISKNAMDGLSRSVSWNELLILMAINIMVGALSYLLFPYLWKS
jgi:heme exporter protein B